MGLRLKFNLALISLFVIGLTASGYVCYNLLQKNARDEVVRNAELMMQTALSIRSYTVKEVKPKLASQLQHTFLPQTVPAYAATETINKLREKYPEYSYKEATLNPTNPRNRAADWERSLVQDFMLDTGQKEIIGERNTELGRILYIARPIRISNPACLACHGQPKAAPQSMVNLYGDENGFGWRQDEIVGAQMVTVPMKLPLENAKQAFITFMVSLSIVFAVLFVVINIMLSYMIVTPIVKMSKTADQVSIGNFDIPEYAPRGEDEMAVLATSFNRMRRSLEKAMRMVTG